MMTGRAGSGQGVGLTGRRRPRRPAPPMPPALPRVPDRNLLRASGPLPVVRYRDPAVRSRAHGSGAIPGDGVRPGEGAVPGVVRFGRAAVARTSEVAVC